MVPACWGPTTTEVDAVRDAASTAPRRPSPQHPRPLRASVPTVALVAMLALAVPTASAQQPPPAARPAGPRALRYAVLNLRGPIGLEPVDLASLTEVLLDAARPLQEPGTPLAGEAELAELLPDGADPDTCDDQGWLTAARELDVQRLLTGELRRVGATVLAELELREVERGQVVSREVASAPNAEALLGPLDEAARALLGLVQHPSLGAWCALPPPPPPEGSALELPLTPAVVRRPAAGELSVGGSPAGARLDIWGPPTFNGGQPLATSLPLAPPIVVPPGRYELRVSHPDHVAWRGSQVIPAHGAWAAEAVLQADVGVLLVSGAPEGFPFSVECRDGFRREAALPGESGKAVRVPVPRGRCTLRTEQRLGWISAPLDVELAGGASRAVDLSPPRAEAAELQRQASPTLVVRWGLVWKPVPGGRFLMGSDTGALDERPRHEVEVPAFEILQSEVTVAMYRACALAGHPGCSPATECPWGQPNYADDERNEHPVVCVNWEMARAFAEWAGDGARLCTEAEWEYAARSGGLEQPYPWGDAPATCARANINTADGAGCDQGNGTLQVCAKPGGHSQHGVCDLAGNVWEWVQDCYEPSHVGAPADGSARLQCSTAGRVRRGGSWYLQAGHARAARRDGRPAASAHPDTGFRVCRSGRP